MEKIIEELQEEIEMDTELLFTISKGMSPVSGKTDFEHAAHSDDSPHYVETPLTDDAVTTMEGWLDEEYLHTISEKNVIAELDDILLLLIAVRDGACGKELLQDLRRVFGANLSPGTVYPHLTGLEDEGMLAFTELKTRKVYRIADTEAVFNQVEPSVNRSLMLLLVLKALLIDCKSRDPQSQRGETDER
jgi:DNA-binding transcriptional ArsR family regulator